MKITAEMLSKMFYYDELSEQAQEAARRNIMIPELDAHHERIGAVSFYLSLCKLERLKRSQGYPVRNDASIHTLINDPLHIKRLINGSLALHKIRCLGLAYLVPYIRDNRTCFLSDGSYAYYDCQTSRVALITNENHYHLNDEQAKAARDAYVMINERGQDYHWKLYRNLMKANKITR